MEDLFKKFVNAGVGFVSLATDRMQKTVDALVKESKLSEQEGAKIMDELKKNGETKRKELEKQVQGIASRMMKSVGVAPNSDVEELKRTVKGSAKPAAAPKASTKPAAKAPAAAKSAAAGTSKAATKTSATASKAAKPAATKKEESGADNA